MSILEKSKQVKVQQISLKERLERLTKGYPSDPEFQIIGVTCYNGRNYSYIKMSLE